MWRSFGFLLESVCIWTVRWHFLQREGGAEPLTYATHKEIMVQVCTLNCHNRSIAAPLGSKLAPLLIGVHVWTSNIHVCNHRNTSAPWRVQICTLRGAKITGAGLHPEGCTYIQVQTSTLTGANLSWFHLHGCKLAFGVQRVLVLWHFGGAKLHLNFLVWTVTESRHERATQGDSREKSET